MKAVLVALATFLLGVASSVQAFYRPPESLEVAVSAIKTRACAPHVASLQTMAADSTATGARAGYLLARCLETLDRTTDAYTMLLETSGRYPPLAAHARYHAARLALDLHRPLDALSALDEVNDGELKRPFGQRLRLLRADALLRVSRTADAARLLQVLLREDGLDDDVLSDGWWLLGLAGDRLGDRGQATRAYGMAWWAVPGNRHAAESVRRLRELHGGRAPVPPADARILRGFRLLMRGQPEDAEAELLAGARGQASGQLTVNAWLQIGVMRGGGRRAVSAFREAVRYPYQVARAQYWLGRSLLSARRAGEGTRVLQRVVSRFGSTPWAPRALLLLARNSEGERSDALFAELERRYPKSASADEARWQRGWRHYRAGRFASAEAVFRDAAQRHPTTPRAAANLYWAAKARSARGQDARIDTAVVAERYPMTFYGQRAAIRLRSIPPPPAPTATSARLPAETFGPAFAELNALGFNAEAAELVEAEVTQSAGRELLRAAAAIRLEVGPIHEALRFSEPAIAPALFGGAPADRELWMLAYPRAYWAAVESTADAAGVDPYLVLAVMREESRFDPQVVSIAGAVGLLQLLPGTASGIAGTTMSATQLTQPEVNIRLGTAYLAGLLRRFRGDMPLALAGYNAGPGAAQRFSRLSRADMDLFFERIPFVETRAYVQRVLQTYGIYRWLYR